MRKTVDSYEQPAWVSHETETVQSKQSSVPGNEVVGHGAGAYYGESGELISHPRDLVRDSLIREMRAEGGQPYKQDAQFSPNEYIQENWEQRTGEILSAERDALTDRLTTLTEEDTAHAVEQTEAQVFEQLHVVRERNSRDVSLLYTQLAHHDSSEQAAVDIYNNIRSNFQTERQYLREITQGNTHPELLAYGASRALELEKMDVELEIRWIEKKMYDLHDAHWSDDKRTFADTIEELKSTQLYPTLVRALDAFRSEQALLTEQKGSIDWSARLGYVVGRSVEIENVLRDAQVTAPRNGSVDENTVVKTGNIAYLRPRPNDTASHVQEAA